MVKGHDDAIWGTKRVASGTAMRVLLLGLDGLAAGHMQWLVANGTMPFLGQMLQRGASGVLKSTIPPYTPQAWTSMVTGVNPGRHGIFGFTRWTSEGRETLVASTDRKVKTIWDLLTEEDRPSIVVNVPMTYPPQPITGVVVSGMGTPPNATDFAYPQGLYEVIQRRFPGYVTDVAIDHTATSSERGAHRTSVAIRKALEERALLMGDLLKEQPWEFAMVVFEAPDRIQHLFWKLLGPDAPDSPERDQALNIYRELDRAMARLVTDTEGGSPLTVIVASDHGFQGLDWVLYLNHVLRKHKLARLKRRPTLRGVSRLAPPVVRRMGARVLGRVSPETLKSSLLSPLDWHRSTAFAGRVYEQGVYVRASGVADRAERRAAVARALLSIEAPDGSGAAVGEILTREDIYHGPWMEGAPDLFPVIRIPRVMVVPGFGDGRNAWSPVLLPHGTHHEDGILVATGPYVQPTTDLAAGICDVAPTILKLLGGPLPRGLDGVPIAALGGSDVEPRDITIERERPEGDAYTAQEEEAVVERLRGLGYID
jgi:predicted AlkP superfamily phosphohydrolase/phosphomutase